MNKYSSILLLLASLLASVCFADDLRGNAVTDPILPADGELNDSTLIEWGDSINLDSLREAQRIERIITPAEESYKRVSTMRFDGFDEKDFYPLVYECYEANIAAMDSLPDHEQFFARTCQRIGRRSNNKRNGGGHVYRYFQN